MDLKKIINLSDDHLKEIEQCQFINECPSFIRASQMSDKTESIESEKLGRYSIAKEKILRGEEVVKLNGSLVDRPFRWTIQIGDAVHVIGSGAVNHHCMDPNLIIDVDRMAMVARKDIEAGEELTLNYLTFEKDMSEPFDCFCSDQENSCYNSIKGFKHLSPQQQDELRNTLGVLPYMA